ncbi:MAG TPA: hypothetical protein VHO68_10350 [Bacteroidales bacterium]|nr:hypothetical protein [Bacteroidales bacterium]
MKKIVIGFIAIVPALFCQAQVNPESMLMKIPAVRSVCGMRTADKDKYISTIRDAEKTIDNELLQRRKEQKSKQEGYEKQAQANVAAQYGISQADIEKMKNSKNLSKEEREKQRREMADKMMMNSGGITMGEIDQIKGDTAAQKAWAEGYSTQKMAEQSYDPEATQKEQKHNKNMFDLVSEQKRLTDSLSAAESKYFKQFDELDQNKMRPVELAEIDSLRSEMYKLMGVDYGQGGEIEALFASIKSKSIAYCNKYSSQYNDILEGYYKFTKSSIPAWNRLQEITLNITQQQTGVSIQEKKGTMALECLQRYIGKLESIDKYYLMSPAADINGNEE